ncbi:MAG: response regulator transcription factor [Chloroflexi bacterium]|nr:response regulator transcription factor [Chloroflexota bacterium]MCL5075136.1 response regulator transcription factor [Chloroflexota bacterium]
MELIRLLLVDDHVLFRKGLSSLIAQREEMQVVGEAGDGQEALEKARELKPGLILMDIHMPGCDGLEATRLIKQEMSDIKILMLTVSDEDEDLFGAIKNGAQGYLLKNIHPEQLFGMIQSVFQGEAPISGTIAAKILREFVRQGAVEMAPVRGELSLREREVLRLVADGATNRQIAVQLCITENTVKNHLCNILEKLHAQNRAQAATYALSKGLI